jgi:hypothetical protein
MSDSDSSEKSSLEKSREWYWYAEVELENVANEFEPLVRESMEMIDVSYSVNPEYGSIRYKPNLQGAVDFLNKKLEFPIVASETSNGIRIKRLDLDMEESDLDSTKGIIEYLDERYENAPPIEEVLEVAKKNGFERSEVEHRIQKLKNKGDVYEPRTGRIRTL